MIRRNPNSTIILIVAAVLVLALAGTAGFFYKKYLDLKQNPNSANEEQTKKLTEKIGKLYNLPKDEQPTVAEVKDKEKLKDQAFFKDVENGDQILIYTKARVAIVYREKDNKIINVGPIAIDAAQQGTEAAAGKVSVKVLNGTNTQGKGTQYADRLKNELASLVNVDGQPSDAKNKNVAKTVVVDVNGNKADAAKQIAQKLGGEVKALPAGEDKPNTDILLIVGQQ